MGTGINADPNEYDFGLDFNYAQWTAGTTVTLCNVPWNNDYRDILSPAALANLDSYIDTSSAPQSTISQMTYVRPNSPIRVPFPVNTVMNYNYLRVNNPLMPVGNDAKKNYYYFITNIAYLAPNTTEITVQLDVWATYGQQANFGRCYIDRGHIGIANSNQMSNYGRDYLAIPEGLDTGAQYRTVAVVNPPLFQASSHSRAVLVVSTVDLTANAGDVNAPVLVSASGNNGGLGLFSGAAMYLWGSDGYFAMWLSGVADKPWVTQGIISITYIPLYDVFYPSDPANMSATPTPAPDHAPVSTGTAVAPAWRDTFLANYLPSRYAGLKKFLTFPYCVIEMTTFSGTPLMVQPEKWNDPNATVLGMMNAFPPDQRIVYMAWSYNASNTAPLPPAGELSIDDYGDFLDTSTMIGDFPQVPAVNNMAINFLAANKNGIAFQYSNADWSQQRALQSNQVAYDQATSGNQLSQQLAQNTIAQNNQGNSIYQQYQAWRGAANTIQGAANNILSGAVIGSAIGAGASEWNNLLDMNQRNEQNTMNNAFVQKNNRAVVSQANYIRDTNKQLADWAARGDYENSIAGINAKVQDSKMTQPSVSGQLGGNAFGMINGTMNLSVRWKLIDPVAIKVIGEYWLRYGYAIRTFVTPPSTLMCMSKFTYWKMLESYLINTDIPENFKQSIRGIFEKGVTVWANPNDIGVIDIADNTALEGISY